MAKILLPLAFLVSACGGSGLDLSGSDNDIVTGYVSDEEKLIYLTSELRNMYDERAIDTSYISSIAELADYTRTVVEVDRPSANIEMIGMATIEQIENDGNNWAIGIMEASLSFETNTFGGSIYDVKQVNTYLKTTTDEFSGKLDVSGDILEYYMAGSAVGTLTNSVGNKINYDFEMIGGLDRTRNGTLAFNGSLNERNGDLNGRFITVEK